LFLNENILRFLTQINGLRKGIHTKTVIMYKKYQTYASKGKINPERK